MEDDQIPTGKVSDWQPTTNKVDLAYLGKTGEELGELVTAIFRCIIQGVTEKEPATGKPNKTWLEDEVADVQMMLGHMTPHFALDTTRIAERRQRKHDFKAPWFNALKVQATPAKRCSNALRHEGKPSPRTCAICGLGPCHVVSGLMAPTAPPLPEVKEAVPIMRSAVGAVIQAVQKEQMDSDAAIDVIMALMLAKQEISP